MTSIFGKILFWFAGTVALAIVGFAATSWLLLGGPPDHHAFIDHVQGLEADAARNALFEGGPGKLARFLRRLDDQTSDRHYLVDASGKDLVDGEDRSAMLARLDSVGKSSSSSPEVRSRTTDDGRYRLLFVHPTSSRGPWDLLPSFLWILFVVVMMGYVLAVHLARPLVGLRRAVERFGGGDLATRVASNRRDEIGELSREFDRMAGRIETLLNAERRLLQDVSHELRSPLARLGFALELARTAVDREAALARARKEANRLADLVSQLLQLTTAEGDPHARTREPVALDELLGEIVTDCSLEAEVLGSGLRLKVEQTAVVVGDPELLRRAVENVIRNAIRHTPEGTAVDIALRVTDGTAFVLVRDRGTGVPEGCLADIFEPFFRVESDRDRASGGIGLGLAIAKRAVAVHHGEINATNAGPGLAVSIALPAAV